MNSKKLPYTHPNLKYWTADKLNAIEATMSWGGGWVDPYPYNVFFLLNRSAALGQGHAAIALCKKGGNLVEYSYCGENSWSPIQPARVAMLKNSFNITFNGLRSNSGWVVHGFLQDNNYWNERYTDCYAMQVTRTSYNAMLAYAATILNNPGTYILATNNCLHFVYNTLAQGNITLVNDTLHNITTIVPNVAFDSIYDVLGADSYGAGKYIF